MAGGSQDHTCGERQGRVSGEGGPGLRGPRPARTPASPLCIWFSCFRHFALLFWNQTCEKKTQTKKKKKKTTQRNNNDNKNGGRPGGC